MNNTLNQEIIKSDILRYKTNKLPATLALLGIVFNVFQRLEDRHLGHIDACAFARCFPLLGRYQGL